MLHYLLCKTLSETRETHFLCFEHHGETIDHGGYEGLENNLKLRVLLAVIDLFDEVVQYADDQLLLLGTWEFLELLRFHHETYQDRGDIFLCETSSMYSTLSSSIVFMRLWASIFPLIFVRVLPFIIYMNINGRDYL